MKSLRILVLLLSFAFAGSLEPAVLKHSEYGQPAFGYTTCYYRLTFGDYQFSTIVEGMCPFFVKIDLTTGQVYP